MPTNDHGAGSSNLHQGERGEAKDAILAQFYAAEYSALMGRVSSWESLQYAAWPIALAAVTFIFQLQVISLNYRWWVALIGFLLVYVAYQGTMVNMLYSVLVIERDLRPRAGKLLGDENFWIYERTRERSFPANPAWSMLWPVIISIAAIAVITGSLAYKYGLHWPDYIYFMVAVILGLFVAILTRNAIRVKKDIVKACIPELEPISRATRVKAMQRG
ncbi:MAG TPA: hypothetical protein VGS07_06165 [Thermoanaerobaculia bacterium]|jgi:hypothetical protein|nr:hypothetical protein [Thermoanaerobaculia bacterium]